MSPSSNPAACSSRRCLTGAAAAVGAVALAGTGGARLAAAQEATPEAAATPTAGSVPPIAQAWVDAQNAMDPAAHAALYAEDATLEDVPNGSAVTRARASFRSRGRSWAS